MDYRFYGHKGNIEKIINTARKRDYFKGEIINETGGAPPHWHITVNQITSVGKLYLNTPNAKPRTHTKRDPFSKLPLERKRGAGPAGPLR